MSEEKVKEETETKKDRKPFIYAIVAIIIPFGILLAGITIFVRYIKGKKLLTKGKGETK